MKQIKVLKLQIKSFLTPYQSKIRKTLRISSVVFLFYLLFFNFVTMNEVTLNHNMIDGTVQCDTIPGFKLSAPWVQVSKIDKRPVVVSVDCACRNLTSKLVAFNPKEYKSFVQKEGWAYYWLRNRISFNMGNKQEWRGFDNVLRGYAFDGQKYKFLIYYQ